MVDFDKPLFEFIDPSKCSFVLEKNQFLTIYLEKLKKNLKWDYLFKVEDKKFETSDPQEFSKIQELEEIEAFNPFQNTSLNDVVMENEDIETDQKSSVITCFSLKDGNVVSSFDTNLDYICSSLEFGSNAVCLKYDEVDGVIADTLNFENEIDNADQKKSLKHVGLISAFSFVRASKNKKRFTYFSDKFGIILEFKRYCYFFEINKTEKNKKILDQYIFDFNDLKEIRYENDKDGAIETSEEEIIGIQIIKGVFVFLRSFSLIVLKL
ncbi:hypothetical protein HK099_005788 [Clydaea vesicula]|uniref:Uncharacterized protein n=1 Tax=Clydaea vesicula TaxID=447962 RepID=A0AAD5TYM2_9FUNG|nr:hypothetical protein HK099_005788 [Clydaea vesicula]